MNFEHNGQNYFVNFVPDEGRWFLFAPSEAGVQRIPVSHDAYMHLDRFVVPPTDEETTVM
jgi:hypothetical protein